MPELQLVWGASTDRGLRRAENEDSFVAAAPVFLVADGMGGHASGALASRRALDAFTDLVGRASVAIDDIERAFRDAVVAVHALEGPAAAPGTTLSGAIVCSQNGQDYWLVLNVGDSRTYRRGDAGLQQVSVDHSAVQELIDRGELDAADAERHPHRNVVTRAVGAGSEGTPDYWLLPIEPGDRLLVCSDGLTKEVDQVRIAAALEAEASPQAAATRLVHEALVHGGRDNVTVLVVDAHGAVEDSDEATIPRAVFDDIDEDTHPRAIDLRRSDSADDPLVAYPGDEAS